MSSRERRRSMGSSICSAARTCAVKFILCSFCSSLLREFWDRRRKHPCEPVLVELLELLLDPGIADLLTGSLIVIQMCLDELDFLFSDEISPRDLQLDCSEGLG